jgi:basic membrane lipoprotein Med (substrate-binding protein (PBP1-ABC) superfamily)
MLLRVQYLSVTCPATQANAIPYLNSLVQRHCDVIVAVGDAQVAALGAAAANYPHTRFVAVGEDRVAGANVTQLPANPPAQVHDELNALITGLVRS